MARKATCIVKIGGSAVTDKVAFETLKSHELQQTARQFAAFLPRRSIVIHGAGSFGHFQAKKFDVVNGFGPESSRLAGFCETRKSVTTLLGHVTAALVEAGVNAVACSPFPNWSCDDRAVNVPESVTNQIVQLLDAGFVPVIHGDAVLDSIRGCTILSGDTIMQTLCQRFQPSYCVFLTDVPGVLDRPPQQGANVIPQVLVEPDGRFTLAPDAIGVVQDVTGDLKDYETGMQGKLECAAAIALLGVPVMVVQVDTTNVEQAVSGAM